MPGDYTIRALTKDDWEIFAAMRLKALKECPGVYKSNYETESEQTKEEWQDWLSQKGKCVFGLYDGADLIGIAGVFTQGKDVSGMTGVLGADYISRDYRGRGLAHMVYEPRINWAQGYLSWKRLVIAHRKGNEASRYANQRWGFQYTHTDKAKIWPDGTSGDELWYELDLEKLRKKT